MDALKRVLGAIWGTKMDQKSREKGLRKEVQQKDEKQKEGGVMWCEVRWWGRAA